MAKEIEVLCDVVNKLHDLQIPYMLTGSFAMNYYTMPRLTRDFDIVILLHKGEVGKLCQSLANEYTIDKDVVVESIEYKSIFNILHNESNMKIDFIIKKDDEYRSIEFDRKKLVKYGSCELYIVTKEDLIISKLIWAKESDSDYQLRDVVNLLRSGFDNDYLMYWIDKLKLKNIFQKCRYD